MSPATLNSLHVAVLLKIAVIAMSFNLVPLDLGAGENGAIADSRALLSFLAQTVASHWGVLRGVRL